MPRFALCLLALCLLCACVAQAEEAAVLPEEIDIYFFHDTACGSCDGTEEFYAAFQSELGTSPLAYPYKLMTYNVFKTDGQAKYQQVLQEYGLAQIPGDFPVMIVYSKVFSGMDSIIKNLREAFLTAGEDIFEKRSVYLPGRDAQRPPFEELPAASEAITILYFYRLTCEECGRTGPVIRALPESVEVAGKAVPVQLLNYNTRSGRNGDKLRLLFEAYEVPSEDQMVPILFIGDHYLAGYDAIASQLQPLLAQSVGVGIRLEKADRQ